MKDLIHKQRVLGPIHRCTSDFSMFFPEDKSHRLYDPALGGGALLDLGIYALTWQMIVLFEDPANNRKAPKVSSSMLKSKLTGVDELVNFGLAFDEMHAQGVGSTTVSMQPKLERTFSRLVSYPRPSSYLCPSDESRC